MFCPSKCMSWFAFSLGISGTTPSVSRGVCRNSALMLYYMHDVSTTCLTPPSQHNMSRLLSCQASALFDTPIWDLEAWQACSPGLLSISLARTHLLPDLDAIVCDVNGLDKSHKCDQGMRILLFSVCWEPDGLRLWCTPHDKPH